MTTITPHRDFDQADRPLDMSDYVLPAAPDGLTRAELECKIAEIEDDIQFGELHGADALLITMLRHDLSQYRAELARARGNGAPDSFRTPSETVPAESFSGLLTWEQFLTATPPTREWTVSEMIPATGLGVIQGRGKQGKSTLVIHLCRAVGLAKPFLGRDTRQSPAVYLNYEMPDDYLQTLIRTAEVPADSYVINRPEPILRLETIDAIVSKVGSNNGLLVIDSFRGAFKLTGKAENLAGEAGVLLRQLQDLAIAKRWFFLLVHHRNRGTTEGTDSISGTGDWIAAPDVILTWSRLEGTEPGTLFLEGRIPPSDPLSVKLSLEECRFLGTVKETKDASDKEAIAAVLTEQGHSADAIAQAAGLPAGTVRVRLDAMFKDGKVERDGTGKKGSPYLWSKLIPHENVSYSAETNSAGATWKSEL